MHVWWIYLLFVTKCSLHSEGFGVRNVLTVGWKESDVARRFRSSNQDEHPDRTRGQVPAVLIKQLRDKTGVGFLECQKALVDSQGSLEDAEWLLKKRGTLSITKRGGQHQSSSGIVGEKL